MALIPNPLRRPAGILAAIFIFFRLTVPVEAADWPAWRGLNRDGISSETQWLSTWPESGPKELWRKNVGIGCSSMAEFGDRLYTVGNLEQKDVVKCLDAATGGELWQHAFDSELDPNMFEGGPGATPATDGERVYVLSRNGHILCLNAADGKPLWSKKAQDDFGAKHPQWGFSGSPLIVGDVVYFAAGALAAFDKKTGRVLWNTKDIGIAYSSPVIFDYRGTRYIAVLNTAGLELYKAADGAFAARKNWKTNPDVNAATPIVDGDRIFISSGYNHGAALTQFDGTEFKTLWESRVMRNKFGTCVLVGSHLYGFDENWLKCVEFATGAEKWKTRDFGNGTLLASHGALVVLGEQGKAATVKASPQGFEMISSHQALEDRCWAMPVLADGRLFLKNNKGALVALNVGK